MLLFLSSGSFAVPGGARSRRLVVLLTSGRPVRSPLLLLGAIGRSRPCTEGTRLGPLLVEEGPGIGGGLLQLCHVVLADRQPQVMIELRVLGHHLRHRVG